MQIINLLLIKNNLKSHSRYDSLTDSCYQIDNNNCFIDSKNNVLDTQRKSNIVKAPLRDIHGSSTFKRFGYVWPDNISMLNNETTKRYGRIWPYGIPSLKSNSPYEYIPVGSKWVSSDLD